ncbi:hypothetical protein MP638_006029 [Amoeboaphelidium occidentale]|nr:hypothetical protein MP638_006029 [Amoeboaphelidium occidentale]
MSSARTADALIIEIGSYSIKYGMNRDLLPRVVRVSDLPEGCFRGLLSSTDRSIKRSWKAFMKFTLRSGLLFGKVKNILLMDSIGFAQFKKKLFQDVMTDLGMEGVTIAWLDLPGLCWMAFPKSSCIVVDVGHSESRISVVSDGRSMESLFSFSNIAGEALSECLELFVRKFGHIEVQVEDGTYEKKSAAEWQCDEAIFWDDLKLTLCSVSLHETEWKTELAKKDSFKVKLKSNTAEERLVVPKWIPSFVCELFWMDTHEWCSYLDAKILEELEFLISSRTDASLTKAIAKVLLEVPVDLRRNCAQNIIICGGSASLPNFGKRFETELKKALSKGSSGSLIAEDVSISTIPHLFNGSDTEGEYANWLGGAILASVVSLKSPEVIGERMRHVRDPHIYQDYLLSR